MLDLGLNYTWLASRSKPGELIATHRMELECNPHTRLTDWLEFYNRNRLEIAWTEGVRHERYRSRNRLQFTLPLKNLQPLESIYFSNEFFYDFSRNDFTLNRAIPVGLNVQLHPPVRLALFYLIQSTQNAHRDWDQVHILGTTLSF